MAPKSVPDTVIVLLFGNVASASSSSSKPAPRPLRGEREVLRIVRHRVLDDRDRRVLGVRERADDRLARVDVERRRAALIGGVVVARAGDVGQRPAGLAASVTVLAPKSVPETVNVLLFGSVASAVVVEVEAGAQAASS